jgi:hypothetical protein
VSKELRERAHTLARKSDEDVNLRDALVLIRDLCDEVDRLAAPRALHGYTASGEPITVRE